MLGTRPEVPYVTTRPDRRVLSKARIEVNLTISPIATSHATHLQTLVAADARLLKHRPQERAVCCDVLDFVVATDGVVEDKLSYVLRSNTPIRRAIDEFVDGRVRWHQNGDIVVIVVGDVLQHVDIRANDVEPVIRDIL